MARSINDLSARLERRARSLEMHVARIEGLFVKRQILISDVHAVYRGALVQFSLEFESALEELFLGLLCGRYISKSATVKPLIPIKTFSLAHALLAGRRGYIDWLPIQRTQERAKLFFLNGEPFAAIGPPRVDVIGEMTAIRNATAHGSAYARDKFRKRCIEGKALLRVEKSPSGYLRGIHAGSQSRLGYLMSDIVLTFKTLAK